MKSPYKKPCAHQPCASLVNAPQTHCQKHLPQHHAQLNKQRKPTPQDKFYHSTRWRKARGGHLSKHPWCTADGCKDIATVVDHITPVADGGEFWNTDNYQSLCHRHHSAKTMREINAKRKDTT